MTQKSEGVSEIHRLIKPSACMPIALSDIPEQVLRRWITGGHGRSSKQDLAGRGSNDKGVGYEGGQINY
jgi:hypothetical protein